LRKRCKDRDSKCEKGRKDKGEMRERHEDKREKQKEGK